MSMMPARRKIVEWRLVEGASYTRDGTTVTPVARILAVRWPGGGFWRARPAGLIVQRNSSRRRLPLLDMTSALQVCIVAVGMLLLARVARRRRV
jgi:hypothetical protein